MAFSGDGQFPSEIQTLKHFKIDQTNYWLLESLYRYQESK